MKKLLAFLVAACVLASPSFAAVKKPAKAPAKKEVKHHKKFEGEAIPTKKK